MIRIPTGHKGYCFCTDCEMIRNAQAILNHSYETEEFARFSREYQSRLVAAAIKCAIDLEEFKSAALTTGHKDNVLRIGDYSKRIEGIRN